jgi:hypothetical protein
MTEQRWYEDMFTPEGVPMTAPTDAGMKGSQNWRYDWIQPKYDYEREENTTPSLSYR